MAGDFTFDFHGFDQDLETVMREYPEETLKFLRKEAAQWKKDCNDAGYGKYTGGKRPIPKSWKNTKEENLWHVATAIEITNSSPLFHLLENGHVKYFMGNGPLGFVSGKHWAEKTREQWKESFPGDVEDYVNSMLGRHNL